MSFWKRKPDEETLLKRRTVLLIDDDLPIRRSTKRLLERQDYVVTTCASGMEGVETYREKHEGIGLILLDVKMPKMNGHETLLELFKINPEVRIVIISGYAREMLVHQCMDDGGLAFLAKPFMKSDLYATIEKYIADA